MTDDEQVKEIIEHEGEHLQKCEFCGRFWNGDIRYLLDRLAEAEREIAGLRAELFAIESLAGAAGELIQKAERMGMERATEIAAQKCYELGLRLDQASAIALAIREEAAKLGGKKSEGVQA